MRVLFIHGGGDNAYAFDQDIVSSLSDALGPTIPIDYQRIEGLEHLDWEATQPLLTQLLQGATPGTMLVAHSIGASAALKVLTNGTSTKIRRAMLLAAPYKAADSHWGIDPFTFPNDFAARLSGNLELAIYHCEDDTVIPVEDAIKYRDKLPNATLSLFNAGGHQFAGNLGAIAKEIRSAARSEPSG